MLNGLSILVAEDDSDDFSFIEEACKSIAPQIRIMGVKNGAEVFIALDKSSDDELPCLIILDFNMPYLNGLQVLNKLKQSDRYKTIPTAIYSSGINSEYVNEVLKSGAFGYFEKSNTVGKIEEDIRKILTASPLIKEHLILN